MKDYIEALRKGQGYDWVRQHGYDLSTTQMIEIIKELDYAIHYHREDLHIDTDIRYLEAADNLADDWINNEEI